jgi:predicted ArsR family transcriptional regulator
MNVLDVIGDAELRETLLAVRRRPRSASIAEIAESTGVHRNVARRRLERLVAAGLLTASFERPPGRTGPGAGRPAKVYSPTPDTTAIEFPVRRYAELVGLLVDAVPAQRLSAIGVEFGAALASSAGVEPADDTRTGLEGLCRALGEIGFQARLEHLEDGRAEIVTPTCPLRPLVVANPAVAEVDHALWRGLVAAAIDDVRVEDVACQTHDCVEPCSSCRITVSLGAAGRA